MSRALKFKFVVHSLHHFGYFEHRQKGSHIIFLHESGKVTVVPKHSHGEVAGGTVGKICRDIGVSYKEFEKFIR
jgi:predicted RNA binding protein YcfA (HicA-like mRNA interferase family)